MIIKELHASNFKSFQSLDLERINCFSVLIGANSSGKSNFLELLRFLKDISRHGLRNAVSMQGGIDYLRNAKLPPQDLAIRVVYDPRLEITRRRKSGTIRVRYRKFTYEFTLEMTGKGRGYRIKRDRLEKEMEFPEGTASGGKAPRRGISVLESSNGRISYSLDVPRSVKLAADEVIPPFLREETLPEGSLLLESVYFSFVHRFEKFFEKIAIYDFDPKLPKRASAGGAKADLEENGSNLAAVLKDILEDSERKRKFSNLLKDLLPFFGDLEIEDVTGKSLIPKLRELYSGSRFLPAPFISDGTINLINIIIALYFEDKSLVVIEEPERNIHPALMPKLVDMMKDAARKKQIMLSTHNVEIVKAAGPADIYLISRGEDGFSHVVRPYEKEEVRKFLENDINIEDLFTKDLLGI